MGPSGELTPRYVGPIEGDAAPQNEADRLTRRFIAHFTAGEREEWLLMLSPTQVTRDRRPLVGVDTTGIEQLAELYPRDRATRSMSSTVETLATRGDGFALVRWRAVSGSGREWDSLHLTHWTADGLNDLNIIFPADELAEATAELEALAAGGERAR